MARRGFQTLAFGPLKPIGLEDPRTGKMPFAVVQLRQDDASASMYNLVGFQTRLKFPEQKRVFSLIPGLENAQFVRYGVMHRNTYLRSPGFLNANYEVIACPGLYFAGQITGVEGYVESAASGLTAGIALAAALKGMPAPDFTAKTVIGGLGRYISAPHSRFDPMNANFSIVEPLRVDIKIKSLSMRPMPSVRLRTSAACFCPERKGERRMRIIAGKYGSRKLKSLDGLDDTRPTLDRVKESLFNILGKRPLRAQVLDLFSGSGSLGLEALSRGAQFCVLNDASPEAVEIIQDNVEALKVQDDTGVMCQDAFAAVDIWPMPAWRLI
jgi:hypothetical protein